MKPTLAIIVLGSLAALPAMAQQSATGAGRPPWQSPGEPLAAAQTTRQYVPNRDVVTAVQQRLNQLGYNTAVNGNYDANLRNNVLRFQSETGLRPTGEVDLSTIGALGINVEPVGVAPTSTAQATPPAAAPQQAMVRGRAYDQLLERDEYQSSPQVRRQVTDLQNAAGIIVPRRDIQVGETPPGVSPGYPIQDLLGYD
ncbi:MAG TPA: peptidoglycan-binding domain-containing protein [Magnetospirillum sp.]|nr:peptidoglycan-binding domain-containing protein [Magnetospirillum sp.]